MPGTALTLTLLSLFLFLCSVTCFENYKFSEAKVEMAQQDTDRAAGNVQLHHTSILSTLLQTAGPVLFLALQVSCIMVAMDIYNLKSVKKLSSVPFASLLANGVLWTAYGWLKEDKTIYIPNAISIATALFCMIVYYKYSLLKPLKIYGASIVVSCVGLVLVANGDATTIGLIGCALSVMMSGSPLAVISTVLKEQSTAALPLWTSVVTWLNTLSWILYGWLIAHDNMILVPNALGFLLASVQMGLFGVYGLPGQSKAEASNRVRRAASAGGSSGGFDSTDNPYQV